MNDDQKPDDDLLEDDHTQPLEPRPEPAQLSARTELPWGLGIFLLLAVLVAVFIVQNTQQVALRFAGWSGFFPLALIIVIVVVVTVVLDEILGLVMRGRRRRRVAEREELRRLRQGKSSR